MEMKVILVKSSSITFNPVEGKEYTKHKYTLKEYADAEYIEDVINKAEEYEMEDKEYNTAYELLVDEKPILRVVHADFRTINPSLDNIFPEFSKIVEEIENYGKLDVDVMRAFPYDDLMENGKWTVDVVTFDTDEPDVINSEFVKVHDIDVSNDELYYVVDVMKHSDDGVFLGYVKEDTKIHNIEFLISYETDKFNLVQVLIKDKDKKTLNNVTCGTYAESTSDMYLDAVSRLILKSSIDTFSKYINIIKDVCNNIEDYIRKTSNEITNEVRHQLHDVLSSLNNYDNILLTELSIERLKCINDQKNMDNTIYKNQSLTKSVRQRFNSKISELNNNVKDKLNMNIYIDNNLNNFYKDNLPYKEMINPVTREILEATSLQYYHPKTETQHNVPYLCNGGSLYMNMNAYSSVIVTKDNRIFVSSPHLINMFNGIVELISKETVLKLIEDLGLTILSEKYYKSGLLKDIVLDKLSIENILYNLYMEISSDKLISRKIVKTLLGDDYNLSSKEVLDYVNEVKNIISEIKESIIDKTINDEMK